MEYNKLIFVAQTGTCREAMAAGIMGDFTLRHPLEYLPQQDPLRDRKVDCFCTVCQVALWCFAFF